MPVNGASVANRRARGRHQSPLRPRRCALTAGAAGRGERRRVRLRGGARCCRRGAPCRWPSCVPAAGARGRRVGVGAVRRECAAAGCDRRCASTVRRRRARPRSTAASAARRRPARLAPVARAAAAAAPRERRATVGLDGGGLQAALRARRDVEVGEQVRRRRVGLDRLGLAELERAVDERPLVQVVPVDEGHRDAGLAGAAGAAGAVQVGVRGRRGRCG